jgi:DNA-directed RNA polymerase specialized sigma24 family protein
LLPQEDKLFSSRRNHASGKRGEEYATSCDFSTIFHDQVNELYTLSLLLTAGQNKAEQCFVAGLEDCLKGSPVFRAWAQSWARRIVIKNAIRMLSPRPRENRVAAWPNQSEPTVPVTDATLVEDITRLACFERFVYVMSVLEGYSARDCSSLLLCTVREVVEARTRALQQLAGARQRVSA